MRRDPEGGSAYMRITEGPSADLPLQEARQCAAEGVDHVRYLVRLTANWS